MRYYKTKRAAEDAAGKQNHLIGQHMLPPYSALPITSITVEKVKTNQGFIVMLSHEVFDNGWPEITSFICPQLELNDYILMTSSKSL